MTTPTRRIRVATAPQGAGYDVVIGTGIRRQLPSLIERHAPAHRYAVITDVHVERQHGARLLQALHGAGHTADLFAFEAGESHKSRESWSGITDAMLEAGLGRDTAVVALGGGVVGDLAGFVAATFLRGIPLVQVPTSLLAMIDASVGGKTGVNTPAGKNLVGAFWPPRVVVIDPEYVRTLSPGHRRGGLAEAIKHAAIADLSYLDEIGARARDLLAAEPEALFEVVSRSVEIKAEVVAGDERESGRRRVLNFGHTVAHALEALLGFRITHGEAVSIGMVAEARIGEAHGVTSPGTAARLRTVLEGIGLPVAIPPSVAPDRILAAALGDKKARQGRAEYVLLREVGEADSNGDRWSHRVPDETVRSVLARPG
jgi:3-dehydroquinate synthase